LAKFSLGSFGIPDNMRLPVGAQSAAMAHLLLLTLLLSLCMPATAMVGGAQPSNLSGPVMIVGSRGNFCTGIAIARDLILTAAHCVQPGADYKLIELDAQRQPTLRDVASIARHPQFDLKSLLAHRATADVSLLKLTAPPPNVASAILAPSSFRAAIGDRLVVAGFGLTERGNGKSGGILRSAELVATGHPGNLQIRLMDPGTRNERAGLGACTGDSGAPVFSTDGRIIGLVSWSTGSSNAEGCGGLTGVTPLSLYHGWIMDTAKKLGSPLAP
jgi:S1-C subfamily serine protease